MQLNATQLEQIVQAARAKAAGQPRWEKAIDRAAEELYSNPYIGEQGNGLLILSEDSGQTYHANGACQCKAYEFHQACWHRAAAQLVKRYREAERQAERERQEAERENAPMVKPQPKGGMRLNGFDL